jgi:hypothetical protein
MAKQNIDGKEQGHRARLHAGHGGDRHLPEEPQQVRHPGHVAGPHPLQQRQGPPKNLLHKEGKGLNVALTCLNYGRCTLSAGMLGGAKRAMDQGIKWARPATSSSAR